MFNINILKKSAYCSVWIVLFTISYTAADLIPGIKQFQQEEDEWCWAAATECVIKYYIPTCTKSQKEIAGVLTTQNIAPPADSIPKCLEENGKPVHLKVDMVMGPMSWQDMKKEIDEKRPFIFLIRWNSGGYHNNVCVGYIGDSTKIRFMDPMDDMGEWTTRSYAACQHLSRGTWERSFKTSINTPVSYEPVGSGRNSAFTIVHADNNNSRNSISLYFSTPSNDVRIVKVFNALGACVLESRLQGNTQRATMIAQTPFPAGAYFVHVANRVAAPGTGNGSFVILK